MSEKQPLAPREKPSPVPQKLVVRRLYLYRPEGYKGFSTH